MEEESDEREEEMMTQMVKEREDQEMTIMIQDKETILLPDQDQLKTRLSSMILPLFTITLLEISMLLLLIIHTLRPLIKIIFKWLLQL